VTVVRLCVLLVPALVDLHDLGFPLACRQASLRAWCWWFVTVPSPRAWLGWLATIVP
jgi:hypothetical protein